MYRDPLKIQTISIVFQCHVFLFWFILIISNRSHVYSAPTYGWQLSILGQLMDGTTGATEGNEIPLHRCKPGVQRSSPLDLTLYCPMYGCAVDAALLSPFNMSNPSPPLLNDLHAFLAHRRQKVIGSMRLGPKNAQDPLTSFFLFFF